MSKSVPPTPPPNQVFGKLAYKGKPKTIEDMDRGVLVEAARQFLDSSKLSSAESQDDTTDESR